MKYLPEMNEKKQKSMYLPKKGIGLMPKSPPKLGGVRGGLNSNAAVRSSTWRQSWD